MFLSFSFSGSETALTSLSDYRLKKLYVKYNFLRYPLTLWILKPYRIIITILIGNTIVNLLLSSTITKILKPQLLIHEELKELIIWLMTTFIVIIFCELLPKLIGKRLSETFSTLCILPLTVLQYVVFVLFSPLLFFVEKNLAVENQTSHFTKIDELKRLLNDSARVMFQRKDIDEIFDRVTKFDDVKVKDIYLPKEHVLAVNIAGKSLTEIVDEVIDTGKTRVPVYEGDSDLILGYIIVKDLFYICSSYKECSISDIIHPILKVNINMKAKDVLKKMQTEQVHIAVVEDNQKKYCGILTLEDILEEIVGDILDEYDTRVPIK